MDLRQLEAVLAIADHGSFSAAANALGTVQSNVSGRIAKLERELDATLIDRSTGSLTEEGQIVATRARRVMGELESIMDDVVATRSDVTGVVRTGMIGTVGRWLIPRALGDLQARHPRIRLFITEGTTTTLEPQLLQGLLDMAIITLPISTSELLAEPLFEEDLRLVVPSEHPLAVAYGQSGEPTPLKALRDMPLLLPLQGTSLRDEIDEAFAPAGITPNALIELDGLRTLASLVFDGYGPGILPATAVPDHLRSRFRLLVLEGFPRRHVGIVTRRHGLPSAPTRAVKDVFAQIGQDVEHLPEGIHPVGSEELAAFHDHGALRSPLA
jgi:LysR family hydrogen peroxide-inducible transcriptional activator